MPTEQKSEQEIQLKKRARRRLVGAVALALLMVTILPMILDDRSSDNSAPDIEITIPSQDSVEESKVFTSENITAPSDVDTPKENDTPSQEDVKVIPVKEIPEKVVAAEKKEVKKAVEATKPKPKPKEAAPKNQQGFMLQVGVFSDEKNVQQLQAKLKAVGLSTNAEKVQTSKGEKIRLRAGPFADKAKADSALALLKNAGLTGMVVKE